VEWVGTVESEQMAEVAELGNPPTVEVAEPETVEQVEMADAAEQPVLETASPVQTARMVPTVERDLACTAAVALAAALEEPAPKPLFLTTVSS
jgi:hypothetical protein